VRFIFPAASAGSADPAAVAASARPQRSRRAERDLAMVCVAVGWARAILRCER